MQFMPSVTAVVENGRGPRRAEPCAAARRGPLLLIDLREVALAEPIQEVDPYVVRTGDKVVQPPA